MAGFGIVNNPRARRNVRAPDAARRLRALLDGQGEVVDAATPDDLMRAVERFRDLDVDVLGVNGGDGTGHLVLTAAVRAYGERPLPPVALLRGGSMNIAADANKLRGTPESILKAILDRRRAGLALRTVERDLLSVQGDAQPPVMGFLFGTNAVASFLEAYYRTGHPSPPTAAALVVRAAASALVGGRFAGSLATPDEVQVSADGEDWPDGPYLAVLAGAVPELGFAFKPFSRCDEQPGFFHAIGVTGSLLQVAAHLPRIWLGLPWRRSLASDAVVRDLLVAGATRFTVDGDLYRATEQVRVRTGPAVRIVVP